VTSPGEVREHTLAGTGRQARRDRSVVTWETKRPKPRNDAIHRFFDRAVRGLVPLQPLTYLSLTEPVTETVGRDDVEHLPRDTVVLFDVELGEFLLQPVGLEFSEQ
jgi:hypothetical protein